MAGSYLATYVVGRQSDRRFHVTVNIPGGKAERITDFATIEQAKAWVRKQVRPDDPKISTRRS